MRVKIHPELELARVRRGDFGSKTGDLYGAFNPIGPRGRMLTVMCSGPELIYGWEHVSVSLPHRTPVWREMCFIKDLFWDESECAMQLHPPRVEYVNHHPHCLHIWRPIDGNIPMPPSILVGPKT
jgi:hypothetical protein